MPLMIVSVGGAEAVRRALPAIPRIAEATVVTVEGIQICKRNGVVVSPPQFGDQLAGGLYNGRKLMIHVAGDTRVGGEALHYQLVEQLRQLGGAGATSLRGIWGYRGQVPANGDSAWSIRRTSPVVTIVIDRDERFAASWEATDLPTRDHGLVTSEFVPAHRALALGREGSAG